MSIPLAGYVYIVLSQIALMLTAVVMLRTGYPAWFGWTVLIVTGLTVIVLVFVSAFPPVLFYLIMWFMGIVLIRINVTHPGAGIADPAGAAGSP